ncbi:MAG: hypothetical protein D6743_04295 [Calditrichaeota bacterium]|nr:MAG: hypothetical protein D6743_04295 [Calditrichota bacterium]
MAFRGWAVFPLTIGTSADPDFPAPPAEAWRNNAPSGKLQAPIMAALSLLWADRRNAVWTFLEPVRREGPTGAGSAAQLREYSACFETKNLAKAASSAPMLSGTHFGAQKQQNSSSPC